MRQFSTMPMRSVGDRVAAEAADLAVAVAVHGGQRNWLSTSKQAPAISAR